MTSELKVDKVSPATGTSTTLGDSGDTFTVPSGVTLDTSSSTLTLPSSVITGQTEKTSLVDADKFLISDSAASGALKYVQKSNLPSGGLVHLSTISITSSTADATFLQGSNGVDINSGTYENFLIIGSGIQVSNDDISIRVSFSIDNGSNYNAQTYRATSQVYVPQSSSSAVAAVEGETSAGSTSIGGAVGNNLGNGFAFTMHLFNLNSVLVKKNVYVESLEELHNLNYRKNSSIISIAEYNAAIDGIRFNCSAGTFSKATFRLYGITNG